MLGVDQDAKTLDTKRAEWAQELLRELQTEDGEHILYNIKLLRQRFEPEVVAKEKASHSGQGTRVSRAQRSGAKFQIY